MGKTLGYYKGKYRNDTTGKSPIFKINYLEGALATTNNQRIRAWLRREQNKQRGIRHRILK